MPRRPTHVEVTFAQGEPAKTEVVESVPFMDRPARFHEDIEVMVVWSEECMFAVAQNDAQMLSTPDEDEDAFASEPTMLQLSFYMNENGRAEKLPKHTVGGFEFFGPVTLVATYYDPATGHEMYADVTAGHVATAKRQLRRRVAADRKRRTELARAMANFA